MNWVQAGAALAEVHYPSHFPASQTSSSSYTQHIHCQILHDYRLSSPVVLQLLQPMSPSKQGVGHTPSSPAAPGSALPPEKEQQLCLGLELPASLLCRAQPKACMTELQGSQVFWPLELIFISNCSKHVFNPVHSAIQAEEII